MNRKGCLTLIVYGIIALAIAALVYAFSAYAWGKTAGYFCAGIATALTFLMLCSLHSGNAGY